MWDSADAGGFSVLLTSGADGRSWDPVGNCLSDNRHSGIAYFSFCDSDITYVCYCIFFSSVLKISTYVRECMF
jgi:hypothetical protein